MSNKLSRIFALLMVSIAFLSAPLLSESVDTPFTVTASAAAKKAPALSAKKKTVYYKAKVTLKVKNNSKKVKWSTSNKKVATVNSKGVVTGVGLGTCTITAKVGSKKLKCKVTVKDRNVSSSVSFKVSSGYFVKGESSATVTVKPKKYNAAKATVYIQNAEGKTVYKKTLKKLTKNKKYTFTWNGKNTKGKYVSGGTYRVVVKIGSKKSYSSYLTFYAKNDFADGAGSKSNPFIVQTGAHLKKIVKYPKGYFKQANDINFNYTAVGGLFSADQPFNGTYDGNGKTIMNISANAPLFNTVGEKGTIKNLKMKNCSVIGDEIALLAKLNYGIINNCTINGIVSFTDYTERNNANVGLMVFYNYGTITNCATSGKITATDYNGTGRSYAGGVVECNQSTGKIISCISHVEVVANGGIFYGGYAGGIAATNIGIISGCEADGNIKSTTFDNDEISLQGGIAGSNSGHILSSYYTGSSSVNIAGENSGVIS